MKLNNNIEIIDLGLYLIKEKTLILSDLHIGIEESLNRQGILIPRSQFQDLLAKLKLLLNNVQVDKIIFNGDLKHEFGEINKQEWNNILNLFDFLKDKEIIILKENLLSPFLTDIENFEVYILEPTEDLNTLSKILYFGKIKDIRRI